ncbi:hypothetical protein [Hydrogenimonas cancrithermarum]|uniref:Type IV pilus biogenesis protein PilP n=1 Tax=Hydrogenimonas cancrithermarum TaxID=2993563 RepID=A0ABM8FKD9_9BACT|nr:hypothetical protein [Hydrogenimonas cancrithermarum]BDY12773.1 hypothetical protein HCR_10850 [Hydrogenimonas cancrithermarum]
MYLRTKEWTLLASPLVLALAIGTVSEYFVGSFDAFLPKYQLYRNVDFEQKIKVYTEIAKKRKAFDEIYKKVKSRPGKSKWLVERYLYRPKASRHRPSAKNRTLTLQMVIPGSGYVIIDDRIYKIGEKVDGYTIAKITNDSVKLKKGNVVKWLELFK